ncbi:hypothetical protein ACH5RR_011831 [Cinchona calisaya]|uniref:DUF8204 domain-containing protein n=1 Tax=Cinchona calisaya TaxID=153742 RepID=A0ABD3A9M4_9GENT
MAAEASPESEKERVVVGHEEKMSSAMETHGHGNNSNCHKNETKEEEEEAAQVPETPAAAPSASSSSPDKINMNKGKSCKGCLYYSSTFKSNSRNPLCVGISRSLPHVPRYIVGQAEMEASKEGRSLRDFRYTCVGYSLYSDRKDRPDDGKELQLPVCVGLEVLVDKKARTTDSTPAHVHNKEDGAGIPQPRPHKPAHSVGDEFLTRAWVCH